jgi:hypothetical protein
LPSASEAACAPGCRHMAAHSEQWDYTRAAIPSALTDEMAQHQEARAVRCSDTKMRCSTAAFVASAF